MSDENLQKHYLAAGREKNGPHATTQRRNERIKKFS
jgi:hypothetical protein